MVDIFNWLIKSLAAIVQAVLSILPDTPFSWDVGSLGPYWAVVNYFIPFGTIAGILATYVTAVAVWYGIRWILRLAQYID